MVSKTKWVIFGDNTFMSKHTFHIQNPSKYLFQLELFTCTLAYMLNGDISHYNKLFDFQCSRFWILAVHLHFGLFWFRWYPHCKHIEVGFRMKYKSMIKISHTCILGVAQNVSWCSLDLAVAQDVFNYVYKNKTI